MPSTERRSGDPLERCCFPSRWATHADALVHSDLLQCALPDRFAPTVVLRSHGGCLTGLCLD